VIALSGCGDNGDNPGSGMAYPFVPPVVNSTRTYSETIFDNSNNTIHVGFTQTVTAVAAVMSALVGSESALIRQFGGFLFIRSIAAIRR
jgi:hypothetical protein